MNLRYSLRLVKQPLVRRRSLVDDARLESARNRGVSHKEDRKEETKEYDLTEEEAILLSRTYVEEKGGNETIFTNMVFTFRKPLLQFLPNILENIKHHDGDVYHLETRQGTRKEIFVSLKISRRGLLKLIKRTRQEDEATVSLLGTGCPVLADIWYPRHISDLDRCCHATEDTDQVLDRSHPGFSDAAYRARRAEIVQIASHYKYGDVIPRVDYTDEEIKTWGAVFCKLSSLYPRYACSTYRTVFKLLEKECGYRPTNIPQLQDVSAFLKKRSGFVLRPAPGLVRARDFLASLAFRVFQCTQYVRHSSSPHHTPEPDCIHELLGHVPMLANSEFAKFSQEIGLASLGASDQEIEKLATVYWFTVEFGLCKEHTEVKTFGAGLLSSFGELQHAMSGLPKLLPFDPKTTSLHPYQDQDFQDEYFVADSFQDAKKKVRDYVTTDIPRNFDIVYDAYTESIQEIDSLQKVENALQDVVAEVSLLKNAVRRLERNFVTQ